MKKILDKKKKKTEKISSYEVNSIQWKASCYNIMLLIKLFRIGPVTGPR